MFYDKLYFVIGSTRIDTREYLISPKQINLKMTKMAKILYWILVLFLLVFTTTKSSADTPDQKRIEELDAQIDSDPNYLDFFEDRR